MSGHMPTRWLVLPLVLVGLVVALRWSQESEEPFHVSGFLEADEIRVGSRVGGRVAAVLDFEFACPAPRALDLAMGLRMTMRVWESGDPWPAARRFLESYAERHPVRATYGWAGEVPDVLQTVVHALRLDASMLPRPSHGIARETRLARPATASSAPRGAWNVLSTVRAAPARRSSSASAPRRSTACWRRAICANTRASRNVCADSPSCCANGGTRIDTGSVNSTSSAIA